MTGKPLRRVFLAPRSLGEERGRNKLAGDTYSRAGRTTMGPERFTAVFGMGTGVSTRVWSPAWSVSVGRRPGLWGAAGPTLYRWQRGEAVSWISAVTCVTSGGVSSAAKRSAVSTGWLSVLPHLHARPIDLVVYEEPSLARDT